MGPSETIPRREAHTKCDDENNTTKHLLCVDATHLVWINLKFSATLYWSEKNWLEVDFLRVEGSKTYACFGITKKTERQGGLPSLLYVPGRLFLHRVFLL